MSFAPRYRKDGPGVKRGVCGGVVGTFFGDWELINLSAYKADHQHLAVTCGRQSGRRLGANLGSVLNEVDFHCRPGDDQLELRLVIGDVSMSRVNGGGVRAFSTLPFLPEVSEPYRRRSCYFPYRDHHL